MHESRLKAARCRLKAASWLLLGAGCASSGPAFGPRAAEHRNAAFEAAAAFDAHLWRDTAPYDDNGHLVAYVEIPAGSAEKFEYRMETNARAVDRVLHPDLGGFITNYGMVPQTVAFDGDPLDILVLGPPLEGGQIVPTVILGVMDMLDEKGPDPKVVASPLAASGDPAYALTRAEQDRLQNWFNGYKRFDTAQGKWARVTGWRSPEAAVRLIDRCRGFFATGQ